VGSVVRVIAVPPGVSRLPRETKRVFRAVLGRRFKVRAILRNPVRAELEVSRVTGTSSRGGRSKTFDTIWVEPEFLA
jgi:hypothetical protein